MAILLPDPLETEVPMIRAHWTNTSTADVEGALAALDAEALRTQVRELLLELDERSHVRAVDSLLQRAARAGKGWTPAALPEAEFLEALAFAEAARRAGYAAPSAVDERLRRGSAAYLRRDYATAQRIFEALLCPIADGEIFLGHDELADDVLGVDPSDCSARAIVCAYMISPEDRRAEAVRAAIERLHCGCFGLAPLRELERAAVEPLPGLEDFLPRWRALVEREATAERQGDQDRGIDRWLREVVSRLDGVEGLAGIARSTKRADDLRAWCRMLVEARDWKAALPAFEEAARLVLGEGYERGYFLDGAALAAQELGRKDLAVRLERAWRSSPDILRLRRWLGAPGNKQSIRKRAAEALEVCPGNARRQRGLLHVILGDLRVAARLLAEAPGLGWSSKDHPGHLLFPLFQTLLGSGGSDSRKGQLPAHELDRDELRVMHSGQDGPCLATPGVGRILKGAGVGGVADRGIRRAMLEAMRKAAERRVEGITGNLRRRHYGHAASLVATCVALDPSKKTVDWVAGIRTRYRRYYAFRSQLDSHIRPT